MMSAAKMRNAMSVNVATATPPGQSVAASCQFFMSGNDSPQNRVTTTNIHVARAADVEFADCVISTSKPSLEAGQDKLFSRPKSLLRPLPCFSFYDTGSQASLSCGSVPKNDVSV